MIDENLYNLEYSGYLVLQRKSDGFINATDFLRKFNDLSNKPKKVISEFWSNESTKSIYSYYLEKNNLKSLHIASRGKGGATWMHADLFTVFFNWCNSIPNLSISRDENLFCQYIEESFEGFLKFERQKRFDNYFVDLYCESISLCIEFDEDFHNRSNKVILDKKRQYFIENKFNVVFIRHKKGENFSKVINSIMKFKQSYNIVQSIKNNKVPKLGLI